MSGKLLALAIVAALTSPPPKAQFPTATPESVGLSAARLRRVEDFMARLQAEGKIAGAVTVVARRGQLVELKAHGLADREAKRPMRTDDIFHLQSMTKPVVTVAALVLLEEQKFLLTDPIDRFLPEFRELKVAVDKGGAPDGYVLAPAERPITILDLLTHRAGFPGIPPGGSPAERLWQKALESLPPHGDYTLEEAVRRMAGLPLDSQPGTVFKYGPASIVLGRVIEVASGRPLDALLREKIFEPLGMKDTAFVVPVEKRARVVAAYSRSLDKGLVRRPADPLAPRFFSGGGNLYSTPADYLRFCQMLLNGGELDGRRVLGRKSVELLTARQVETMPNPFLRGQYFGLGVAVQKADGESGLISSPGAYGWNGAYNTYFRIDPKERLILMLFVQQDFSPHDLELEYGFHNAVMQAIVD